MDNNLEQKHCRACELGEGKLDEVATNALLTHTPKWSIIENREIIRKFKLKNFASALAFVNKVGEIAESEGHHPDIKFGWGYVEITLTTHAVNGLSENDFIMASKIDRITFEE
jgi:4a-hydroxytetrahydrobiopterin dehydratase